MVHNGNRAIVHGICNGKYIGASKKKVLTRNKEHQQGSIKGNWNASGTTKHIKDLMGISSS